MKNLKRLAEPSFFLALAIAFLWKVTLSGQALVPAGMLSYLAPWTTDPDKRPLWNPLMYDSVGQFLPWRRFLADSLHKGFIPLWNPYVFCGTPFLANSQSSPLYPPNWLYLLLSDVTAPGWIAVLHLTLAGWFTSLFLKRIGLSRNPALFGGIAFAFCTWQVSWLELPTFLNTSCWLPLALLLVMNVIQKPTLGAVAGLGAVLGMSLLAGHLQIAFYVLLATILFALYLFVANRLSKLEARLPVTRLVMILSSLVLAGMIASPQVLPSLELSRVSHRVSNPSEAGYAAYTAYSVGAEYLVTAVLPDFYGNPSNKDSPYFGESKGGVPFNYAEGSLFVGIPTLFLAVLGLTTLKRNRNAGFLGALGLLALLMALGTAVDRLFYFYVPGFGQSGSPGRVLVLWAFALSGLAAIGLEKMLKAETSFKSNWNAMAVTVGIMTSVIVLAIASLRPAHIGDVQLVPLLIRLAIPGIFSIALTLLPNKWSSRKVGVGVTAIFVLMVDLYSQGIGYPQTSPKSEVYPETELTKYLKTAAGHDRVMPVNTRNFSFKGPNVVLPPNTLMAYGIRDIQGYDSLFTGQYKTFMNQLAFKVALDSSPVEVGNMVFAKDPLSSLVDMAGIRVIVSQLPLPFSSNESSVKDGVYVYPLPNARGRAALQGSTGTIKWITDEADRIDLEVNSPFPCQFTIADQRYPGWIATVDDRPEKISSSTGIMSKPFPQSARFARSVKISGGTHRVVMKFEPMSYRAGLFFLMAAISILSFTLTRSYFVRRSKYVVSAI